jgi:hypothetical protein
MKHPDMAKRQKKKFISKVHQILDVERGKNKVKCHFH